MPRRAARGLLAATLAAAVVTGCGGSDDGTATAASDTPETTASTAAASPLADAIRPLPPAPNTPEIPGTGPAPTGLSIGALDVADAPVRAVGVEANGEMEIPAVDEVGWYRYGAAPGAPGSAVLAAHIAYGGVDGVFRHLDDLREGDEVSVNLDDGSTQAFVVDRVEQVPKAELPAEVWVRDGDPSLVLITCGGEFDDAADSYEDNVVAYARPA